MDDAQWQRVLSQGHEVISKVELWNNGRLVIPRLPILDGSVDVDGSASIRRKFNCSIAVRKGKGFLTTPGVTELRPYRGLRYRGEERYWPLGQFRVSGDDISQTRDSLDYQIESFDISRTLSVSRLYEPVSVAAGTPVERAIEKLLSKVASGLVFLWPSESAGTTPALVFDEGANPWEEAQKLYLKYGYDLFIDVTGRVAGSMVQDTADSAIRTYDATKLFVVSNQRSDEPGYNGIKVVGEPDDGPSYISYIWDDDPESPTYWRGPYGRRIRFYKSKFLTTQAQCDIVARRLYEASGLTTEAKFETFVDPTLEVNKIVAVKAPDVSLDARFVARSFSIPLRLDSNMAVATAKVRGGRTATDLPEAA